MFIPTTVFIKLLHLLHSLTDYSYFCFSVSFFPVYHAKYFPRHSIETQNHLSIFRLFLSFDTSDSIINEVYISYKYSALSDGSEAVGSLVNEIFFSLLTFSSSNSLQFQTLKLYYHIDKKNSQ